MEPESQELQVARAAAGLPEDLRSVTLEQFTAMSRQAATGSLSLEYLQLVLQAMPHFVDLQRSMIEGLRQVANEAGSSQREALQGITRSLDGAWRPLEILAQNAQSDETRLEIAKRVTEIGKMAVEVADIAKQTNSDNNVFWWKLGGVAAMVVVGLGLAVLTGGRVNRI